MRAIAERCFQLEGSRGANGYVVSGDGRTAVIDPGLASGHDALLAELGRWRDRTGPVTDILLTHYDVDHSGVVARLQRSLGVPVWIGAPDAAILRGEVRPATRLRRLLFRLVPIAYPAAVRELAGPTEVFDGLAAVPTPGHTPGHLAFHWGPVLFSGDAVMVSRSGRLRQFIAPLISDKPQARASQALLEARVASEHVEWVCAGHSPPRRLRP